jgi:hypothetical protein
LATDAAFRMIVSEHASLARRINHSFFKMFDYGNALRQQEGNQPIDQYSRPGESEDA